MKVAFVLSCLLSLYAPESASGFRIAHKKKAGSRPKILCLHGGGGTGDVFRGEAGMPALMNALPNYEFVFVSARDAPGNSGNVWIRDPPGGKSNPTTDPDFASATINYLNQVVETQGPFYGILGYSQGSAFAGLYLSIAPPGTFQVAMLFCGYLPETHLGLMQRIEAGSPIATRALLFMGVHDYVISNGQTREQATKFTSPVVVTSSEAGHNVPYSSDSTFNQVVAFIRDPDADPLPTPAPTPAPPATDCPTFASKPTPDAQGDCACPGWYYCTRSGSWGDCPYSGGLGDKNGRFSATCADCRCEPSWR